jgi:Domain of unknown function (DUF4136)
MKYRLLALAAFGIGLMFAADVKTDYDHSADFSRYRTYSWIKVDAGNSLWSDRITRDVDAQLSAKGLTKVASGGDLGVSAFGSTHNQQSLESFYNGFGGGWFWRGLGGDVTTEVINTPVGSLVVDVFDGQTKHLVWRASSTETLSDNPDKNDKKLEHEVGDMFKRFPPEHK